MSKNKLYIAAAGSGKTTLLVNEALKLRPARLLITTFTEANAIGIREKISSHNGGSIPPHITIQQWCSFLLEHGVRPYQSWPDRTTGMQLVNEKSGYYITKRGKRYFGEDSDFYKHYFNILMEVYSDKLAKLVVRCNQKSQGHVMKRMEKIYSHIFVDEVQDMEGWDFEILKLILKSKIHLTLVGDPRQTVYRTHHDTKYPRYSDGKVQDFLLEKCRGLDYEIDSSTLVKSHRNCQAICDIAFTLYPNLPKCDSISPYTTEHMGIYMVKEKMIKIYDEMFQPIHLRYSKSEKRVIGNQVRNFGEAKGLEFSHVLIYPTKDMVKWFWDKSVELKNETRSKLYVALTRAKFSVGIVIKDSISSSPEGISLWEPNMMCSRR